MPTNTYVTIWKYELEVTDEQVLAVPGVRQPLTVQIQHGDPMLWVQVDPEAPRRPLSVRTVGTGHPASMPGFGYVGTYQLLNGRVVFHVFAKDT